MSSKLKLKVGHLYKGDDEGIYLITEYDVETNLFFCGQTPFSENGIGAKSNNLSYPLRLYDSSVNESKILRLTHEVSRYE